jgi:hypothetical protein
LELSLKTAQDTVKQPRLKMRSQLSILGRISRNYIYCHGSQASFGGGKDAAKLDEALAKVKALLSWKFLAYGGKQSATPLWKKIADGFTLRKRCRRCALPAQSKSCRPSRAFSGGYGRNHF